MNCRHLEDNLEAYVRNELDAASEAAVKSHIETCANCRSRHEAIFAVYVALQGLPTLQAHDDFNRRALEKTAQLRQARETTYALQDVTRYDINYHGVGRRKAPGAARSAVQGSRSVFRPVLIGAAFGIVAMLLVLLSSPQGRQGVDVVRQAAQATFWGASVQPNHVPLHAEPLVHATPTAEANPAEPNHAEPGDDK
jgi:anti-sigma factor RsiW